MLDKHITITEYTGIDTNTNDIFDKICIQVCLVSIYTPLLQKYINEIKIYIYKLFNIIEISFTPSSEFSYIKWI